jgi:hypothetical protein
LQPASDIYALKMTAIQALTGVHPQQLKVDLHGVHGKIYVMSAQI